jgi:hypothetical protein
MLTRYRMIRGKRPPDDPLPAGIRQDTRWRTKHCIRPAEELVKTYLGNPTASAWERYVRRYRAIIEERFREDPEPFDRLAALARVKDVYFGCSCPTLTNPDPSHCHTVLALGFFKEKYPDLDVRFPS